MITMKKITSLLLFILISGIGAYAQTEQKEEVSDQEIKQFASAFQQIQAVDQMAQQDMIKAVEDEGLDVERYNEIQQTAQDPNQEIDVNGDELKKYEIATREIEKIQMEAQQQMQEKIVEEGLTIDRYQEIAAVIQNDPELQQKLQKYLQG
jgi:hypothetical protein